MKPCAVCLARLWCAVASLLVAVRCVAAAPADAERPAVDRLPGLAREAKAEFRPLSQSDLAKAKTELTQAVHRLDRALTAAGANGADWRKYLQWGRMQKELARESPDLAALYSVGKKYEAGHEGLRMVWFVGVRDALKRYLQIAGGLNDPNLKTAYGKVLDDLATRLEAYAAKPTPPQGEAIGTIVAWLEDMRQAPGLVRAVKRHFVQPNLYLKVSSHVVGSGIAGPVDDVRPVRDCILGTDVYGTGHTVGHTQVELAPDASRAIVDTRFFGTAYTDAIGYHGPVEIYSSTVARMAAVKRLWIDADGLAALPAAANAAASTSIHDIEASRLRRIVERAAWKRAGKQKPLAECIASRHAEDKLCEQMDREAADNLARANRAFAEKFRRPLVQHTLFPRLLSFSSTKEALQVMSLQAEASQLAASTAPPALTEQADLAVQVHESMVNNSAASVLAGMLLRQDTLQNMLIDVFGELPEQFEETGDEEPWAISFALAEPISVTFADDQVRITIRGRRYYKGDEPHQGMNVAAVYKVVNGPEGCKAVREGRLEITPPGRQVIRTLLEQRFNRIFKEKMFGDDVVLPGKWAKAGTMRPVQMVSRGGWLAVAWRRVEAGQTVAQDK